MPPDNNQIPSPATIAFGSGDKTLIKPKKSSPYRSYKVLCFLMLIPPLLLGMFLAFVSIFQDSGITQEQSNAQTILFVLLMIPTVYLMIVWNFSAIPFFLYSAFVLSKATKPKISISTIILSVICMVVIPTMYFISIFNIDDGSTEITDLLLAPYLLTVSLFD